MHTNACIYALCMRGGSRFFLWKIHKYFYCHFETVFKTNGAWGQELWTIAISFGEGFDAVLDICYIVLSGTGMSNIFWGRCLCLRNEHRHIQHNFSIFMRG